MANLTKRENETDNRNSGILDANVGIAERLISVISGGYLLYLGLKDIQSKSTKSIALTSTGGMLVFRGATGFCPMNHMVGRNTANNSDEVAAEIEMTINRPREEVFAYWRKLENLPNFMHHLESVTELSDSSSHWVANIPAGLGTIEWDATIMDEEENAYLAWGSMEGADIENSGEVEFADGDSEETTVIRAYIRYNPPIGKVGEVAAKIFNPLFEKMVKNDLERFKEVMENGNEKFANSGNTHSRSQKEENFELYGKNN